MRRTPAIAALAAAAALAVVGCSSSGSSSSSAGGGSSSSASGRTVDIYSSLPLQGASTAQTVPLVNGIKLALSQAGNKAGQWTVNYQSLDDSTAAAGKWDPGQTAANARKVATDPKAVYYIGEFNSGASEVSIPILNQAGLPQVSPANTYVGLTTNLPPASAPGEPQKYYPSGTRTYLRIVPIDSIQAASDLIAMKKAGCTKVAIANDKEAYGCRPGDAARAGEGLLRGQHRKQHRDRPDHAQLPLLRVDNPGPGSRLLLLRRHHRQWRASRSSRTSTRRCPRPRSSAVTASARTTWTSAAKGGVPASIDPLMECTVATLNLAAYPGGKDFLAAYKAKYGTANPDPYAIYGYEVMKLGLDTIAKLGAQGNSKSDVLKALFATTARNSVLGTYGFDKNGDTTLKAYGLYKVGSNGEPVFFKTITPTKTVQG